MSTPSEQKQIRKAVEAVRSKMRDAHEASGLTQEQVGVKMGFSKESARKAVSRLLNAENYDPRVSTVVAFAKAVGKPLSEFL